MRKVIVMAVAISLLFASGVPVSAGPPIEESFDFVGFSCDLSGEAGSGFVSVFSEDGSVFADAFVWLPGSEPFVDEPDLFSDFEGVDVAIVGDEVSAVIPMLFAEAGEPDGTLIVDGLVGELLDEETFSDRFREGNRWVEFTETIQFFAATAEVTLDETPFEASCSAERGDVEFRSTNPHAFRIDFEDAFVECFGVAGSDGSILNLFAGEFGSEAFLNLEIFPSGGDGELGPPELFGSADIGRLSGNINVLVPLFDPFDDEEPVTEAQVSMTVEDGEMSVSDIVFQDGRVKETETQLQVSGTVQVALDDRSYDLNDCFGSRFEARGIVNPAEGPKMSGMPPSNDTPEGAVPLDIGDTATQQTKAAALDPEVACSFVFEDEEFEEIFELPIGKTVWYTVEGTGGPITVSTAGSHFDTILGVYTSNGDGLEQVACVDDVFDAGFSLQAEVTFESELGETYFFQAGGFGLFQDPEFPEFSSLPEYGLLRISVFG
jgi:hypothetical protein